MTSQPLPFVQGTVSPDPGDRHQVFTSTALVFAGRPGSGKSTICRALESELTAAEVSFVSARDFSEICKQEAARAAWRRILSVLGGDRSTWRIIVTGLGCIRWVRPTHWPAVLQIVFQLARLRQCLRHAFSHRKRLVLVDQFVEHKLKALLMLTRNSLPQGVQNRLLDACYCEFDALFVAISIDPFVAAQRIVPRDKVPPTAVKTNSANAFCWATVLEAVATRDRIRVCQLRGEEPVSDKVARVRQFISTTSVYERMERTTCVEQATRKRGSTAAGID